MKNLLKACILPAFLLLTAKTIAQDYNFQLRATMEFPGQTLANVCGYSAGGREYALVGASYGLIVIDVTNPDIPVQIVQIPGPHNLWKEIKTYSNYAYVTSEGGGGVQIVDLSGLPGSNLTYHSYSGDGAGAGLNSIHALHIDTNRGYLYLYGSNLVPKGAYVYDLNNDPYNPTYVGSFTALDYIHDGYALNDTMYAAHIYTGQMSIVDFKNKQNPILLGTVTTPAKFTHNTWLLSDHRYILTTDEKIPSFVTCYDISVPDDIKEVSRISTNDGTNSIGHNVQVINDWSVTSWYEDGVAIVDAHKPDNLVIVGRYDTYPLSGPDENGCWGVYPYFPSGTVVATNIPVYPLVNNELGKFFVLTPTYVRACYLEGKITDGCNGQPMVGATIHIENGTAGADALSKNDGVFKTGNAAPGAFTVIVSKTGYITQTFNVNLSAGQVTTLNTTMVVDNAINVDAVVKDGTSQAPLAYTAVDVEGNGQSLLLTTNGTGEINLNCIPAGTYRVGVWGYLPGTLTVDASGNTSISLQRGYYDDFELNLGWSASGNASTGFWVRGKPIGVLSNGMLIHPDADVTVDNNDNCYVTGIGDGQPGGDDVDNGSVTLTSPNMQLANYQDVTLSFYYWFYNGLGNGTPNDNFTIQVSNGTQTATVLNQTVSQTGWRYSGDISLKSLIPLTNHMSVSFTASDINPGHVVEAGLDVFKVVPGALSTQTALDQTISFRAMPNPSGSIFNLQYDWQNAGKLTLEVRNTLGQLMLTRVLEAGSGTISCGENWPKGAYMATLRSETAQRMPVKLVKE